MKLTDHDLTIEMIEKSELETLLIEFLFSDIIKTEIINQIHEIIKAKKSKELNV